jgi:hypothetical protein
MTWRPTLERFPFTSDHDRTPDEPFVVIARSDSDAAILSIPLLEIALSLALLAMTAGAMTAGAMTTGLILVCHRYNENCWIMR